MWKEITLILIGFCLGTYSGVSIQTLLLKPFIGDDFQINKPKVKGEDNILQVLQNNNKKENKPEKNNKERKIKIFKRKNK